MVSLPRACRRRFDVVHLFSFCVAATLMFYIIAGLYSGGSSARELNTGDRGEPRGKFSPWSDGTQSQNGWVGQKGRIEPSERAKRRGFMKSADVIKYPVVYDKQSPLIWIGGVPRSGTTLARALLDAHPDVRCGEETRVIPRMLAIHSRMMGNDAEKRRLEAAGVSGPVLDRALASYLLSIVAYHGEPAARLCNKDPFSLRSIGKLSELFPRSQFLLMIRDGRAVANSIVSRKVTIKGFNLSNYESTLRDWNRAMAGMWNECARRRDTCLPVYYERLVLEPKDQLKRILTFLNLPWDEAVLHHEKEVGKPGGISLSKKELSTDQVNKPISQNALLNWVKAIPPNVQSNLFQVAPMLSNLGYDPRPFPPNYSKDIRPRAEDSMFRPQFPVPGRPRQPAEVKGEPEDM